MTWSRIPSKRHLLTATSDQVCGRNTNALHLLRGTAHMNLSFFGRCLVASVLAAAAWVGQAFGAAFTVGDVVILRVGDGSTTIGTNATAVFTTAREAFAQMRVPRLVERTERLAETLGLALDTAPGA